MGVLVNKPKLDALEKTYVTEVSKGLAVTAKRFFENTFTPIASQEEREAIGASGTNQIATISYPEERRTYPERFRGIHRLTQRDDGSARCVACLCCSTACPAQCIFIEAGEYEPGDPRYGYERYPVRFVIDELRCIFCGMCVEACPCDAIRMDTGMHMPPSTEREHFIYDKETLLSLPGRDGTYKTANPRHEPGDPTHPGLDRDHH